MFVSKESETYERKKKDMKNDDDDNDAIWLSMLKRNKSISNTKDI